MSFRVFDHQYNVVTINRSDVTFIKLTNRQFEYHTLTKVYYGASNATQELELQSDTSFFVVDKKNSINMKYIERFVDEGVFVNGVLYKLSRRKLVLLKSQLRKYIPHSQ